MDGQVVIQLQGPLHRPGRVSSTLTFVTRGLWFWSAIKTSWFNSQFLGGGSMVGGETGTRKHVRRCLINFTYRKNV